MAVAALTVRVTFTFPSTGPDTREIFWLDAPGVDLGPPANWTAYHFDMDYKTWVSGADGRASNELEWEVRMN